MKLTRTNTLLIGLAIFQLVAVIALFASGAGAGAPPTNTAAILPNLIPDDVTGITVKDGAGAAVTMLKDSEGAWSLPNAGNYPVEAFRVESLLNAMKGLDTSRLIAQNKANHARLKVADEDYERLIEITTRQGETQRLYLGTSSGANSTHVRRGGRDNVYLVGGLNTWEISTRAAQWVNAVYLAIPQPEVATITVTNGNGTFTFDKAGEAWTFAGLNAGEVFNTAQIEAILSRVATIRLDDPLGTTNEAVYGMDAPLAVITIQTRKEITPTPDPSATPVGVDVPLPLTPNASSVNATVEEKTYTLTIGAKTEAGTGYYVKSSESDHYVILAAATTETFTNLTRDSLILPPTPTPTPTATAIPSATPAVTATSEATATPTVTATATITSTTQPSLTATPTPTATPNQ
ncbi:MAG TPA: DUF4340 domain-containing protein [Aggregatilineales bacterium]|nr:DUF4340 domain-containing protein [Anaerolineales bacterium]HRE47283.1 DUF4340 domain-containing protein [Aggregatilineales bacterium]